MTSTVPGAPVTKSISPTRNRLTNTTGPSPAKTNQYDDASNLINDGTASFTYSARGRMASATVGGYTVNYLYNGLDQRVLRSGGASNASTMFFYDEQGRLIGEYNFSTGKVVQEFVYLDDLPVAVLQQSRSGTAPNEVVATSTYYLYPDHINTPRIITRANDNKIVWRWDSGDPFGLIPPNDNPSGLGSFAFNMRMPGQYLDRDTNLFYNYFRDYDPQAGRYMQSDPIGLQADINTYAYVGGNPLSSIDPEGLEVSLCSQPAFGIPWNPIDHHWIKTDSVEAGMGGTRGNVPGNDSGDMPGDPVQVTDHSGRSKEAGASCDKVENVDEQKVNAQLKIGRPLGRWGPTNQCQSFASEVLRNASTAPASTRVPPLVLIPNF